jgi:CRISPR-associated protein Csy2
MTPPKIDALLLLTRLRVQNANAISSQLTWGFPAPTTILGFVHDLQRRLNAQGLDLRFGAVGIVCHGFEPQVHTQGYKQVFSLTRNPFDKDGKPPAFVERGRTHFDVSLLITVSGDRCPIEAGDQRKLAAQVLRIAEGMRMAGGTIVQHPQRSQHPAVWADWTQEKDQESVFAQFRKRLAPGFVLLSRASLLADHLRDMQQTQPETTALDALLDLCAVHHTPPRSADASEHDGDPASGASEWTVTRRKPGWLVPLPVGYAAISPLYAPGEVKNARNNETPFRFVENVFSLGEWVGQHRVKSLQEMLWAHHAQPEAGLYTAKNHGVTETDDATTTSTV